MNILSRKFEISIEIDGPIVLHIKKLFQYRPFAPDGLFLSIDSWLEEIYKNVGDDVFILIFANKSDLMDDPDQIEEI